MVAQSSSLDAVPSAGRQGDEGALWYALRRARQHLVLGLREALDTSERELSDGGETGDTVDATSLAVQLGTLYRDALVVFGQAGRLPDAVEVSSSAEAASVSIYSKGGLLSLERDGQGRWTDHQFGLYGESLATLLADWPVFQVPDQPPQEVNRALVVLRELLHDPEAIGMAELHTVLDAHVAPALHAYVQHHVESWPQPLIDRFDAYRERRFVGHGLTLLREQIAAPIHDVFRVCSNPTWSHPTRLKRLVDQLAPTLDVGCVRWNAVVGTEARFALYIDVDTVIIQDERSRCMEMCVVWKEGRWSAHRSDLPDGGDTHPAQGLVHMLCLDHNPIDEDDVWFVEHEAKLCEEAEALFAQQILGDQGHIAEDPEQDVHAWEEDGNWRVAHILEGMESERAPIGAEPFIDGEPDWDEELDGDPDSYGGLFVYERVIDADWDPDDVLFTP